MGARLRTSRTALLPAAVLALSSVHVGLAQPSCDFKDPGLYGEKLGCEGATCIEPVHRDRQGDATLCSDQSKNNTDCLLESPNNYRFYYKSPVSKVDLNSVVVVQQQIENQVLVRREPSKVVLTRDSTDFACWDQHKGAYPPEVKGQPKIVQVSFDGYDRYHRYGKAFDSETRLLAQEYHIKYLNNPNLTCSGWFSRNGVWTNGDERRPFFLLYARNQFPMSGAQIAASRVTGPFAGVPVIGAFASALAGESGEPKPTQFAQFKVHMTSYKVKPGESGCFSFTVVTDPAGMPNLPLKQVDVTLRDLELLQNLSFDEKALSLSFRHDQHIVG